MVMDGLLVGRDTECAALRSRLSVSRAGPVPVVLVTGEAGAGKTTLVEHVLASTSPQVLRGRAATWACPAYEVVASALRPAVRSAAGPLPAVLAQVMPELGAVPAEPSPAAVAAAVCSVLAAAAGGRAVTLFLDDLQWADEASLDLLAALADAVCGLPVALVGCYRSDELPRGHRLRAVRALLRRNHRLAEIELGPLGDDDVKQMLTGLWGAAPQPALAAAVASRADGLPFAVEELAFALRDGGRLAYRDGAVTLAGAGGAPVPEGIREAVLLRASRLTDEERALVEAAAVAGIEFDVEIVLAVAGAAAWPDGFTASGLLTEARDGRAAFRHSLTQEAAYADIPWSRRRRLHRALAGTLAGHDAAPALIAVHHLAARDFGRPAGRCSRRPKSITRRTPTGMPPARCGRRWNTGHRASRTTPGWRSSTGSPGALRCARSTPTRSCCCASSPMGRSAAATATRWPAPAGGWLWPMSCAGSGNPR